MYRPDPDPDPDPATVTRWAELQAALEVEIAQLKQVVTSPTLIGQAEGILMERHGLTAEGAFCALSTISENLGQNLAEVAADLVTGCPTGRPARSGHPTPTRGQPQPAVALGRRTPPSHQPRPSAGPPTGPGPVQADPARADLGPDRPPPRGPE